MPVPPYMLLPGTPPAAHIHSEVVRSEAVCTETVCTEAVCTETRAA